jgi:competence protein ComEA
VGEEHSSVAARLDAWRGDRRIVAAVCACVALAAGVAWWRAGASAAPASVSVPRVVEAPTTTTSTRPSELVVDVVGAVRRPGVVHIRAGARVADAIDAAGGARPDADLVRLNLAAPVADGARVAVPAVGAPAPAVDPAAVTGAGSSPGGVSADSPVNLNSATAEQLDELPGVGPATADAIVRDREAHGPFTSVDDLARVRGIGPAKLEQLRDLVTT